MKSMPCLFGVIAATVLAASQASAVPVLPEGTSITGDPTSLLGYDASANDYLTGGVSAVDDLNIEFLTDDFALGIDFQSDGLLRLWDNLGSGADLFNYTLQFSFAGLNGFLSSIQLNDVSAVTGGDLLVRLIDDDTFELTLRNVQFAAGFSYADIGIGVDEPSLLALFALGLAFAARRRRSSLVSNAEVAP